MALADLADRALRFLGLRNAGGDAVATYTGDYQKWLSQLAIIDEHRVKGYELYERYYDGDQGTQLTERARAFLERSGIRYAENFSETIISAQADRMHVTGFECARNDAAAAWASNFWDGDAVAEVQGTVHTQTPLKGDGFVAVGWNATARQPELYWNDPACCNPVYDPDGNLICNAKTWAEQRVTPTNPKGTRIRRLNVYWPDRIEKWFTTSEGGDDAEWAMHLDPEDTGWPMLWVRNDGTPRGVALIHFRNKAKGRTFGRSELHSVLPQQDYLNKQLIDLAMIMDNQAWAQRYASGIDPDKAATFKAIAGELWATTKSRTDVEFGQFEAADPSGAIEAVDSTLRRISARSSTPLHLLFSVGALPSGETLKTAESPLVHKSLDRQPSNGLSWATAAEISAGLAADYGPPPVYAEPAKPAEGEDPLEPELLEGLPGYAGEPMKALWRDPASRNELVEAQTAVTKQEAGVSKRTTIGEMGYDPEEEAANRRDEALEAMAAFNAGTAPGVTPPDTPPGRGAGDPGESGTGQGAAPPDA